MRKKQWNNWGLKLISLLIAFLMWFLVINIEDPVDEKSFANVKVSLINTELITDKNMVYEIIDGTGVIRNVKVSAPKKTLDELRESDIVAEVDFANITVNNTVEINFFSNRYNEKIKSISGSIEMVKFNIEEKRDKRQLLVVETEGEPAEGYLVGNINMDQNMVLATGPKSLVSTIDKAVVKVDVTDSTSDISTYAEVVLYDAEGNIVPTDNLSINTTSVRVSVQILATKEVPLEYSVMGTPAQGYMFTGEIESNPATVRIAGSSSVIGGINSIVIPGEAINITGQNTDMTTIINLKDYLPENVLLVGSFNGKVSVTAHIEKQEKRELTVKADHILVTGMPNGFKAEMDSDITEYTVNVMGLSEEIRALNQETIYGYLRIADLMEKYNLEEMKPGVYQVVVEFTFADRIIQENELHVNLKIVSSEE